MNDIELIHNWKDSDSLKINGKLHFIFIETIDYTKNFNPVHSYNVEISPDYNPTGKITIASRTIKGLIGKLNKLPYRISAIS